MNRYISISDFFHQALVTVTPAFLSPTSAKPRIATPLLVRKFTVSETNSLLVKRIKSWLENSL